MSALKPKHQRLVLVIIALVALVGAGLLAAWALRTRADYFLTPSEIVAERPAPSRAVRLGGMVQKGSLETEADGITSTFTVGDGATTVPVRFAGILPDLFVEGSGVVAEGRYQADGTFVADNLLAKHDENYVPRELQDMQGHKTPDTLVEASGS